MPVDILEALLPLAIGLALFPQILLTALLLSTTQDGRHKDLALMLGVVSGALAGCGLLLALATLLGEPMGGRGRELAAGLISLFFGLTFLADAVRGVWRLTYKRESFEDFKSLTGLTGALERITPAAAFKSGVRAATWNQRAPLLLMPAAVIIASAPLRLGQSIAALLIFAGVTGLGVAAVVGIVALPRARAEQSLLRFRGWLEGHGGAVKLGLSAVLAVVLLTKSVMLLQAAGPAPAAMRAPGNTSSCVALRQQRDYDSRWET